MTPPGDDYYAVLGVAPDAELDVIRTAYRRQARTAHPDRGGSAEDFSRIQQAWEVLGDLDKRAEYDRRRGGGSAAGHAKPAQASESGADDPSSPAFTYSPRGGTWASSARSRKAGSSSRPSTKESPTPSGQALAAPVYDPDLASAQPLSLTVTSQKVHGENTVRGIFGAGRARRVQGRVTDLISRHVLDELPAARLFLDVLLSPAENLPTGRRAAKSLPRAEFVLVCGHELVLVSAVETPTEAVSWDGTAIRAAGRRVPLPDGAEAVHALQRTLTQQLREQHGRETLLSLSHQTMLLSADGGLLSPAVQATGPAARSAAGGAQSTPLAAGRALSRIVGTLGTAARPNLVDRYLLATLREQLAAPDSE